jgi:hypothetical protein
MNSVALLPHEASGVTEPLALQPCPHCGQWQWQLGLVDGICAACGNRGGPPSQKPVTPPEYKENGWTRCKKL